MNSLAAVIHKSKGNVSSNSEKVEQPCPKAITAK